MDDLERQLHRYADQVEDAVGEVTLPAAGASRSGDGPTSSRRSPLLLAVAAVVLVLIGLAALALRDDDAAQPVATDPDVTIAPDVPASPDDTDADSSDELSDEAAVPDVVGLLVDDARQVLFDAGFNFELTFESRDDVPANIVFAQQTISTTAGPQVAVRLSVSAGVAETVPNVIGETQASATSIMQGLGYSVLVVATTSPQEAGTVIGQNPAPGAALAPGQVVELSVSGGPEVVPVPDVEGLDLVTAINLLLEAGFAIDEAQLAEPSAVVSEGLVVRTVPAANTLLAAGSRVALVVSVDGATVEVPFVEDLFADDAPHPGLDGGDGLRSRARRFALGRPGAESVAGRVRRGRSRHDRGDHGR